jgi:predicted Zn-dependent protease
MRIASVAALALLAAIALPVRAGLSEADQRARLLLEVSQQEERLQHAGVLMDDPALNAYLQEITDRLFPDHKGELHVHTIRDSDFNAFAMPSGSIYFNTGALLRIRDEAQLATVLGHEGTHYTADHAFKQVVRDKRTAGTLILTPLFTLSLWAGYSREQEREADRGGFERMTSSGYDGHAGVELFGLMDRELTVRHLPRGGYFWADHPAVKERVATLTELAAGKSGGTERNRERYLAATERARMEALEVIHRRHDADLLVFLLDDEKLLDTLPPRARFYLAEGLRLRGQPGDTDRAGTEYETTVKTAPEDPNAYQALGVRFMRDGHRSEALAMLRQYVKLEPDQSRSSYARQYITTLEQEAQ